MVGVYLLAMVDAYVDASLSHFDISPDLSMDVVPALMQDGRHTFCNQLRSRFSSFTLGENMSM